VNLGLQPDAATSACSGTNLFQYIPGRSWRDPAFGKSTYSRQTG